MDAVEIDPENLLGDTSSPKSMLGSAIRPASAQSSCREMTITIAHSARSIPGAGRCASIRPGHYSGRPRPAPPRGTARGVEVDGVGGPLDLNRLGFGYDPLSCRTTFGKIDCERVPCRSVTGQRIEASAERLGKAASGARPHG